MASSPGKSGIERPLEAALVAGGRREGAQRSGQGRPARLERRQEHVRAPDEHAAVPEVLPARQVLLGVGAVRLLGEVRHPVEPGPHLRAALDVAEVGLGAGGADAEGEQHALAPGGLEGPAGVGDEGVHVVDEVVGREHHEGAGAAALEPRGRRADGRRRVARDGLADDGHAGALGAHGLDQVARGEDEHALARDQAQGAVERGAEQGAATAGQREELLRPFGTAPWPEALAAAPGQDQDGVVLGGRSINGTSVPGTIAQTPGGGRDARRAGRGRSRRPLRAGTASARADAGIVLRGQARGHAPSRRSVANSQLGVR